MEEEFYDFAYDHFQMIKRKTLVWSSAKSRFVAREKQFHFEKIGPAPASLGALMGASIGASIGAPTTQLAPEMTDKVPPVEERIKELVRKRRSWGNRS